MTFNPDEYLSSLYAETTPPSPMDDPALNARIADAYDASTWPWYRNIKTQSMIVGICAIPAVVVAFNILNAVVTPNSAEDVPVSSPQQDEDSAEEQLDKERAANALFDLESDSATQEKDTSSQPATNISKANPAAQKRSSRTPAVPVPTVQRTAVPTTVPPPAPVPRSVPLTVTPPRPVIAPVQAARPTFTPPTAVNTAAIARPPLASPAQIVTYRATPGTINSTATLPAASQNMANERYQSPAAAPTQAMARLHLPQVVFSDNETQSISATLTEPFSTGAITVPAGTQLTLSARVSPAGYLHATVHTATAPDGRMLDIANFAGARVLTSQQTPLIAQKTTSLGDDIAETIAQSVQRGIGEAFNEADVLEGLAPDIPIIGELLENTVETTLSHAETRAKAVAAVEPVVTWQLPAATPAYLVSEAYPDLSEVPMADQHRTLPAAPAPAIQETEAITFGQPLVALAAPPAPVPAPVISADSPRFAVHTTGSDMPPAPQPKAPAAMPVRSLPVTPGVGRSLITVNGDRIVTAFASQSQQVAINFDAPLCADGAGGCSTASAQVMHLLVSETATLPISITVITEGQAGRHLHTIMLEPAPDASEIAPIRLETPSHETSHVVI